MTMIHTHKPNTPMAMIQINSLTKTYRDLTAVRDLNLTIEKGDVFGFIGPNGAGKTTTIKILATLLEPTAGWAYVDGIDVVRNPLEVRRVIGYMPDFFGVYDDVKVWEYLDFFAAAYKIPVAKRKGIIDDVLELTDLTGKREAYVESLSRGMKQRLCLAKTLVHDPKVLLLDEPASGLDPRARIEFRALLKELQAMGKTIFVSSHILPELADFCNKVGIMERGHLVVAGSVNDIVQRLEGHIVLDVRLTGNSDGGARALQVLNGYPHIKEARTEGGHVTIDFTGTHDDLPPLLAHLVSQGVPVASFSQREADLEDVFMKVTKGMVQ
jgi:ABC-2 type transport system ATP-binding protein